MVAIELNSVTKQYGDVTALRDVNLTVEEGEIFGFLGPNGAGKSTTIDILLDFVRPTSGTATVLGFDAQRESFEVHKRVGVLPDGYHLYDRLTGRQHMEFAIRSKGADDDPDAILERVGIADAADRKTGGYSKGMKQRLVLGMALVGKPELLILDEPSTGLDPKGAREMRTIIEEERARGATVFFSSHILEQVEAVCDRVGILMGGELVAVDTIEGLRSAVSTEQTLSITTDRPVDEPTLNAIRTVEGVSQATAAETAVAVTLESRSKSAVLNALEERGVVVEDFSTEEASLEELFMAYTADSTPAGTEVSA
ncbi:ABC-2 type transport system ATP-binding protein [Haladaptatus litoreus]|uniref:ABC-2 type transport system ATP-binding protein n=1 Tax=Haladaptatus litoreus TaxID=553468 RepID=A0A1N6VQX7_9EURY|nr:ABC transporter ATP-binding protein [Haladaptatus litoreus]SIQ80261.1 ABC-2 type transport system ATP-binding protein [Haladaptatus litoreus]